MRRPIYSPASKDRIIWLRRIGWRAASRPGLEEDIVETTTSKGWDRHGILAAIKRRYGTLTRMAERFDADVRHVTVALRRPYPKAEKVISQALGVPAQELWPDRFDKAGRRLRRQRMAAAPQSQSEKFDKTNGRAA